MKDLQASPPRLIDPVPDMCPNHKILLPFLVRPCAFSFRSLLTRRTAELLAGASNLGSVKLKKKVPPF
jgi:hypothetical protein